MSDPWLGLAAADEPPAVGCPSRARRPLSYLCGGLHRQGRGQVAVDDMGGIQR